MARPTTRSNTSTPSRDKLHGEPTRPAAPAPIPVPDPIAPPPRPSTRPFHQPTPRPTTQSISPLPSRLVIIASFWAVIVLALPFWWRTTTIERRPLPLAQIEQWVNKDPCYLTPKVSFAFESPAANKDPKVEQAIHATMNRLAKTELAQCLDVQWAQNGENATYRILLTDDDELLKRRFPPKTVPVSTKPGNLIAPSPSMAKFSPTYKLVFSLLNEDSFSGDALLEWQIHSLLKRHVEPLLSALEPLHNFTIDTSIQYFAPLTLPVQTIEGEGSWIVEDDLRAFVNNADWKLPTSLTLDPILHFILFVPKKQHRPLRIKTLDGRSSPTGFITPQRGGVVIYNPPNIDPSTPSENPVKPPNLSTAFRLFEAQLRKLLGVSPTLPGPDFVTSWQIDALVRQRLNGVVKEAVESLSSLRRLVEEVENMRVGKGVQKGVRRALEELKLVSHLWGGSCPTFLYPKGKPKRKRTLLTAPLTFLLFQLKQAETHLPYSPPLSLHHAFEALSLASKAYFDPSMLALLYFPDNHKYAIYTPLFGPVAVPLLMALGKEWKKRRGRGRGEEGEMEEKEKEKKEEEKEKEKEDEKGKEESSS
ncbi:BZ3500_MvSof-1268-A1-R1_Chr3-1g06053 [Microbotryum saponariae]|uniref:BZ3500_MvSof-1268-A1-R1_Chr3-1g06053 protein n=1 Tax=Microbotryum saponariae TaxID=289078 RepID=A0A2X0KZ67_9BASI|nr:BZ3500_MvSof-1268-A1-R1_Chr3-1g06053 [Microbotryum saponariae]SDA03870.1 BZ3501_MvSof-1269-A2-R1_Chr3-2g05738 [Microbotryum saponariae]